MIWFSTTQDKVTEEWIVSIHDSKLYSGMTNEEIVQKARLLEVYRGPSEEKADEIHKGLKDIFYRACRTGAAMERLDWMNWCKRRRKKLPGVAPEKIAGCPEPVQYDERGDPKEPA